MGKKREKPFWPRLAQKLAVGKKVAVPVRFNEEGEIIEIRGRGKKTKYGVKFDSLDMVLFYEAGELVLVEKLPPGHKPVKWFHLKNLR